MNQEEKTARAWAASLYIYAIHEVGVDKEKIATVFQEFYRDATPAKRKAIRWVLADPPGFTP
ncbi:MAG: hypothetical protein M1368_06720 [Thaumarchaeota archaeon]|nr:hypothetical protein [Nitrososphaerota archaeon]